MATKPKERKCKGCNIIFDLTKFRNANIKYCSSDCQKRNQYVNQLSGSGLSLPTGTIGAISELVVSTDLMVKGWHVFRALSPSCPCDLIIMKEGILKRIEVRTGYITSLDTVQFPLSEKDKGRSDHIAVYARKQDKIIYIPELE